MTRPSSPPHFTHGSVPVLARTAVREPVAAAVGVDVAALALADGVKLGEPVAPVVAAGMLGADDGCFVGDSEGCSDVTVGVLLLGCEVGSEGVSTGEGGTDGLGYADELSVGVPIGVAGVDAGAVGVVGVDVTGDVGVPLEGPPVGMGTVAVADGVGVGVLAHAGPSITLYGVPIPAPYARNPPSCAYSNEPDDHSDDTGVPCAS